MRSNSFVYTTAIALIAHFIGWLLRMPKSLSHWWRTLFNWHRIRQRNKRHGYYRTAATRITAMYEFRPFELTRCDYKSYAKATSIGRGIHVLPKPRSGHRIVANETDLFSFGGKHLV